MKMTWSWHEVDMKLTCFDVSSYEFFTFLGICLVTELMNLCELISSHGDTWISCFTHVTVHLRSYEILIDIEWYWHIVLYDDIVWYCKILYDSCWSSAISAILSGSFDLRWWILQRCNGAQRSFQARTDHFDAIKGRVQYVSIIVYHYWHQSVQCLISFYGDTLVIQDLYPSPCLLRTDGWQLTEPYFVRAAAWMQLGTTGWKVWKVFVNICNMFYWQSFFWSYLPVQKVSDLIRRSTMISLTVMNDWAWFSYI